MVNMEQIIGVLFCSAWLISVRVAKEHAAASDSVDDRNATCGCLACKAHVPMLQIALQDGCAAGNSAAQM